MKLAELIVLFTCLAAYATVQDAPPGDPAPSASGADLASAQQAYIDLLHIEDAWATTKGEPDCLVGVVDTGFDFFHPALKERISPGYFASGVYHTPTIELIAHGTAIASVIIASPGSDPSGMTGFAPGCRVLTASIGMPEHRLLKLQRELRRANPDASATDLQKEMIKHATELQDFGREWIDYVTRTTAEGIRYLVDHGVRVINISAFLARDILGAYPDFAARLDQAFADAESRDVVMVIGAGNTGAEVREYPGTPDETIVVGATTLEDERWEMSVEQMGMSITQGSSFGPRLSVMAPSVDIASAMPHEAGFYTVSDSPTGASQGTFEGPFHVQAVGATSMATPVVTSLVALVRSARPDLSASEVVQIIQRSAVDLDDGGVDRKTGHGRIDFRAALEMAQSWPRALQR